MSHGPARSAVRQHIKELTIQHMMTTSFWSPDGKPMSAPEFIQSLYGQLPELFKNEAELRHIWSHPDTRKALLDGLSERGFNLQALTEIGKMINAEKSDLFDVLARIAYECPPITRTDRVETHRERIFSQYSDKAGEFLEFVLERYIQEGVSELDNEKLPYLIDLKYHTITDAAPELGSPEAIRNIFVGFQRHLYSKLGAA